MWDSMVWEAMLADCLKQLDPCKGCTDWVVKISTKNKCFCSKTR